MTYKTQCFILWFLALVPACGGVSNSPSDADADNERDSDNAADADADADREGDADDTTDADVFDDADDDADDASLTSCTCQPGSHRTCSTPGGLGTQRCTDLGDGWEQCVESTPPVACNGLASGSLELFLCLLHENLCIEDWPDADGDGDRAESLGRCQGVICPPLGCFCFPGSWRVCDVPAYTFGGVCYCRNDGSEWGRGLEQFSILGDPCVSPNGWCYAECLSCLVDAGTICVQDYWDTDSDGDTWESVGDCDGVICGL